MMIVHEAQTKCFTFAFSIGSIINADKQTGNEKKSCVEYLKPNCSQIYYSNNIWTALNAGILLIL